MPIDAASLDSDPVRQLDRWLAEATDAGLPLPNAFALATADGDAVPSVRFVLLQGLDAEGLRFFTSRASRKGRELAVNPWAAAAFWWADLDRQVRVTGPIRLLPEEASLEYWRTRPRGSQVSATASAQSQEIGSRDELEARAREVEARHPGEIPLPPTWGGYLLSPRVVEFWESRPDRLHDRVEYRRGGDGSWNSRRLQP
ncbi:MAG TPA: pyridoxamine 5'-phosphate oxidase [Candidatus Binatia bacterium]|nr:pyridoxamine 5'-phosphate oxidase [Candidatus Binatia bacterium]